MSPARAPSCPGGDSERSLSLRRRLGGEREYERERERDDDLDMERRFEFGARYGDLERRGLRGDLGGGPRYDDLAMVSPEPSRREERDEAPLCSLVELLTPPSLDSDVYGLDAFSSSPRLLPPRYLSPSAKEDARGFILPGGTLKLHRQVPCARGWKTLG